jgi:hypothetical protein
MAYRKKFVKNQISNISAAALVLMIVAILLWAGNRIMKKIARNRGDLTTPTKPIIKIATNAIIGVSMITVGTLLLAAFPPLGATLIVLGLIAVIIPFFDLDFALDTFAEESDSSAT